MSRENQETVRGSNDAFVRGDKAAWLDDFDSDVVMIPARDWPENSPTRGTEALWDFYTQATANWEGGSLEVGEMVDVGDDQVVGHARYGGHGKLSGAGFEFSYWFVSTFRNGKTTRTEWFSDRAQALEAAGLSE